MEVDQIPLRKIKLCKNDKHFPNEGVNSLPKSAKRQILLLPFPRQELLSEQFVGTMYSEKEIMSDILCYKNHYVF